MITPAKTAKVLDFGIAKLQVAHGRVEEGRTIANTHPNVALGTRRASWSGSAARIRGAAVR